MAQDPGQGGANASTQQQQQAEKEGGSKASIYQAGRAASINRLYDEAVRLWEEAQMVPYANAKKNLVRAANLKLDAIWLGYLNPDQRKLVPTFNEVLDRVGADMTQRFWNDVADQHDDLNTIANKKVVVEARLMLEALNIRLFEHFYAVFVANDWFDYKPEFSPWGGGKGPDPRKGGKK